MTKTFISAKDLELIALREIRSFPGCEHVLYIEIEVEQKPSLVDANWALTATARDGADLDRIQYALKTSSRKLKQRYSLRTDW